MISHNYSPLKRLSFILFFSSRKCMISSPLFV
uniref:Uncharacterized protein n=1 Tax=Anguilla anguilla TaxID=7936 RepID=A0A0E9RB58_ANGAN